MRIVGLFAGIGGIESGFRAALGEQARTELLCEWWEPAQRVLEARFGDVPLHPDVRQLRDLPRGTDVVAAGFPCTDLSQAGRTAGITGGQSSLVSHVFEALRLTRRRRRRLPWLVIENVPNMLSLDRGEAMHYLVGELEALGYRWAYRVVDSRFTGVPQRRRRVLLVASRTHDPRQVLFADEAGERPESDLAEDAYGFYWTEGRGGLGWARDAVPTLKGGSTIGIPSPPAVWVPGASPGRRLITPQIGDAEALQGFPRGWTAPAETVPRRNGPRWKLVGNAVTVGVAAWLAGRIAEPGEMILDAEPWSGPRSWPTAAWGERGKVWRVAASEYPRLQPYRHLLDVLDADQAPTLSHRGTAGFLGRLSQGNLGRHPGFREDVIAHRELTAPVEGATSTSLAG
ncbi:MAG: DNA (cytosine-5-)-methyltransferase [Kineosporiaceae bacterium]|nr:DNA (cytosine-5-)-methyltransferase [Kineosporiaceae bacterium]